MVREAAGKVGKADTKWPPASGAAGHGEATAGECIPCYLNDCSRQPPSTFVQEGPDSAPLLHESRWGGQTGVMATVEEVRRGIDQSQRIVVLTGAGISTHSGIPDFR